MPPDHTKPVDFHISTNPEDDPFLSFAGMEPFGARLIEPQGDADEDQPVHNASYFDCPEGNHLTHCDIGFAMHHQSLDPFDSHGILDRYDAIPIRGTDNNDSGFDMLDTGIVSVAAAENTADAIATSTLDKHTPALHIYDIVDDTNMMAQTENSKLDLPDGTMTRRERNSSSSSGTLTATIGQLTPLSRQSAVLEDDAPPAILSKVWTLPPRCTFDSTAPEGPCRRCKSQVMPCVRYRITDTTLYREQEAPYHLFSQRWKSMDMVDITNWASDEIRTIEISLDFLHAPSRIKVREFIPLPGDCLDETWVKDGETIIHPLPPYAIANMKEAADAIALMVEREAWNYLWKSVGSLEEDSLIWETYLAAFRRANTAPSQEEQILLFNTIRLWVHCRISSNAEHMVGDDKLGTRPIDDPTSPYHGTVPIPPVLEAQLECIYFSRFLRPMSKKVLRSLMTLLEAKQTKYWYTIYLVLFMMLHSCSMITRRDREYAATIGLPGYANPESIRQHNAGSRTLLAHFHLALNGSHPFKLALQGTLPDHAFLGASGTEDINFITRSAKLAARSKPSWDQIRRAGTWENDFYWISQLYEDDWKPEKMD
ncbi:hypothetical protein CEP51_014881 [Fusarium floridanum]|uniref:Zn(2)-C6 fungal-type domain-containing protein n=1 Tax=Fusarium floridanum TaxID=1325733 RepID=A0A428PKH6_9HYPO|nr:hypothetical protein CEP51_014881 [Fusarium floridanum]